MTKIIEIGIFFDGTGNNYYNAIDKGKCETQTSSENPRFSSYNTSKTNISRLYCSHKSSDKENVFSIYIDGIGTVREYPDSVIWEAFGDYILTSPSTIENPSNLSTFKTNLINMCLKAIPKIINLFTWIKNSSLILLVFYKYTGSYKINKASRRLIRVIEKKSNNKIGILETIKKKSKNEDLIEIHFNIFGFSRGASLARHYTNILENIINGSSILKYIPFTKTRKIDKYFKNAKVKINFVGLFDTVESYTKVWNKNKFKQDIFDIAQTTCHLTAYHESRENFPLTRLLNEKQMVDFKENIKIMNNNSFYLQNNNKEYLELCLPGAHADIGGGYNESINNEKKEKNFNEKKEESFLKNLNLLERTNIITVLKSKKWSKIVEIDESNKTFKYGNKDNDLQFFYYHLMKNLAKSKGCSLKDIQNEKNIDDNLSTIALSDINDELSKITLSGVNNNIKNTYEELFIKIDEKFKNLIHISFDFKPSLSCFTRYSKLYSIFFPMRPTKDLERKIKN